MQTLVLVTKNGKPFFTASFDNRRKAQAYCCRWNSPRADKQYKAAIVKEVR